MPRETTFLGSRIRQARRQAGLSQSQLAALTGAHVTSVSDWERGVNQPTLRYLTSIAEATGKSIDWFVEPRDPFRETAATAA
jgi:transcriptional regulator with XRE-family HTH domain